MNTRALWLSALIAGVVMALLAEIPVISLFNCVCCIWLWGAGIFSVFLYRKFSKDASTLSIAQGLGVGALSGLIGAVIGAVLNVVFGPIHGLIIKGMSSLLDPESARMFGSIPMMANPTFLTAIAENLVTYIIFGAIGGLIAVAVIWKPAKVVPATPPETPLPPA
jgi:hypothetical protein